MRHLLILLIVFWAQAVQADVVSVHENGFQLTISVPVQALPKAVYNNFINHVDKWWDKAHTHSGDSANLSFDNRPGGQLLEKLPEGGFVRHFEIVYLKPQSTIRLRGAMGPLQEHGVTGAMTIQFLPIENGTNVNVTYNVGGYIPGGLKTMKAWSPAVNQVITEQFQRLRDYSEEKPPGQKNQKPAVAKPGKTASAPRDRDRAGNAGLPNSNPAEVGMDPLRLQAIDRIVQEGLDRKRMPGAVVLIARSGRIVFHKSYGSRQLLPQAEPMQLDTVFDMASITKPVATAMCIMKLTEQNKIAITDPVARHIPEFAAQAKDAITIEQLLTHTSGLIPDNHIRDYEDGPETAMQRVMALKLWAETGEKFAYSDVGFIVLAEIVRRVSGKNVHEFSQQHIFRPLGMHETGFLPSASLRARCAVTEKRGDQWMEGEVHDPRAFRLGGIAGHAGLFSTALDLARFGQMLNKGGELNGVRILKASTVQQMTQARQVPGDMLRGLGWDKRSSYSSNRGDLLSASAFGHGGFTGTVLWIDPQLDLVFVFLSNRVHPDGKGSINKLAGRIATVAAAAIKE